MLNSYSQTHSLNHLIETLESRLQYEMSAADAICIGAAGHYNGKTLWHENPYPYSMPFEDIAIEKNWPTYSIIHDYATIVCATFTSYMTEKDNLTLLNNQPIEPFGRRVALGIGTGLGLKDGVLLPTGDFWLGQNEAGHIGISLPPQTDSFRYKRHQEVIHYLQSQLSLEPNRAVTFEKILSGKGTARLHQFFYPNQGKVTPERAGETMRQYKTSEMVATLAWYAGLFVGSIQLNFMPESGIWITGGVALSHPELFDHPDFFLGVKSSPAYLTQRETYPLGIMQNPQHALMGSAYYAAKRLIND